MGACILIAGGLALLANAVGDTVILNISILLVCSISQLEKSSLGMLGHTPWDMYRFGCRSCLLRGTLKFRRTLYY